MKYISKIICGVLKIEGIKVEKVVVADSLSNYIYAGKVIRVSDHKKTSIYHPEPHLNIYKTRFKREDIFSVIDKVLALYGRDPFYWKIYQEAYRLLVEEKKSELLDGLKKKNYLKYIELYCPHLMLRARRYEEAIKGLINLDDIKVEY